MGPKFGYSPFAKKTILITKRGYMQKAKNNFGKNGMDLSDEVEKHMGAVIGNESFKDNYVNEKIEN